MVSSSEYEIPINTDSTPRMPTIKTKMDDGKYFKKVVLRASKIPTRKAIAFR